VVPMANGGLRQEGLLATWLRSQGSEEGFRGLLERRGQGARVVLAPPGQDRGFLL